MTRKKSTMRSSKNSHASRLKLPSITYDSVPTDTPLREDHLNLSAFGGKEFKNS